MPDFGIMRGFNDKLFGDKLVAGQLPTQLGVIGSQEAFEFDVDAQAFFDRVTAAGGTLSVTEKAAVNTLVVDMKAAGIWTLQKAIYPMVGASAAACAQNLKSSSFTVSFASGITYSSSGILGNGTSGYGDTGFNVNTSPTDKNSVHCSVYQINNVTEFKSTVGATTTGGGNGLGIFTRYQAGSGEFYGQAYNPSVLAIMANTNSTGFYVATRTSLVTAKQYKTIGGVTTSATNITTTTSGVNGNFYLLGNGFANTFNYSGAQINFCSIGEGLSDANQSSFYTAVQAFQTTLSRQV
jgi:hypothetical protein